MTQTQWPSTDPIERVGSIQTLYASFADSSLAERAAGALLDYGVRNEDISLVAKEHKQEELHDRLAYDGRPTLADRSMDEMETTAPYEQTPVVNRYPGDNPFNLNRIEDPDNTELSAKSGISTTTPEDAAAGAAKGAGIGLGVSETPRIDRIRATPIGRS